MDHSVLPQDVYKRHRLYFTVEEAKDKLHRSRQVVTRAFQELERCGLIVRRKQDVYKRQVSLSNPSKVRAAVPVVHEKHGVFESVVGGV